MTTSVQTSDTDLVVASRRGDRDAFSQIVRRYQGLISGLIYSACGNIAASEDIAQETFIAAWKSLSGLRNPEKLSAWLCQIARRRVTDHLRKSPRRSMPLEDHHADLDPTPPEQAISEELRHLLWQNLAQIPEPYRETMVMYYRQEHSAEAVAAALEISEENVRQRLTRGRQLLREQIAQVLERDLARTAPQSQFTSAVMASLPMMLSQTLTTGAVAKAGATKTGIGLLTTLGFWLGPLYGLGAGIFSTIDTIRSAQSRAERKFVIKTVIILWVVLIVTIGGFVLLHDSLDLRGQVSFIAHSIFWFAYAIFACIGAVFFWKRRSAIRIAHGNDPLPHRVQSRRAIVTTLIAADVGGLFWVLLFGGPARDVPWLIATGALLAGLVLFASLCARRATNIMEAKPLWHIGIVATFGFVALNLRMPHWYAVINGLDDDQVLKTFPRLGINLMFASIFFFAMATSAVPMLMFRKRR